MCELNLDDAIKNRLSMVTVFYLFVMIQEEESTQQLTNYFNFYLQNYLHK